MNITSKYKEFKSVEDLIEYTKTLELGYENLMAHCRVDLDCRGNTKQVVNYVHDYCASVLDGEIPNWEKE
jgi:hypothetical protein